MTQELLKPQALQTWFDLQSATLRRVHASWFGPGAAELIALARTRPLGRRFLANRLGREQPLLFELPQDTSDLAMQVLRKAEWVLPIMEDAEGCALDLGSLALAPTLRTIVARSAVMKLRQVLGTERYEKMLAAAAVASGANSDHVLTEADEGIVESVLRCGAWELEGFAASLHPLWAESVRLSFEREWWQGERTYSLRGDAIEATLRLRLQQIQQAPVTPAAGVAA